ncbi:MAG TPA: 30S ribosomal protein S17 [Candidatus Ozemobacteraceae bacterium]|nr:30S ribosomal protein S17 [Candidatus Ozemobacteraceae bacterium]
METNKTHHRTRVGRVIAGKTAKTVKVQIEGMVQHPRYKKYIKRTTTFLAHDEEGICKVGDMVRVEECRPVSKSKHWIVREVITHGQAADVEEAKESAE